MITTFALYDENNSLIETFTGPYRLAQMEIPAGWNIEEFIGTVSRGIITHAAIKAIVGV